MTGGPPPAPRDLSATKAALLERWLKGKAPGDGAGGADAIRRGEGPAPVSSAQQRLWFLRQLDPTSPAYNMFVAHRLRGALDVAALERALGEIVRRHEVLRTTFSDGPDGLPRVTVGPAAPVRLALDDLAALPAGERDARLRTVLAEEAAAPIDFERGPILRARLARLSPDEHVLVVTVHHVAFDEWSEAAFNRELGVLYGAFAAGAASPLPELPIQYGDFARWQRERLSADALRAPVERWRRRLEGVPPLDLPGDRPRPTQPTMRGRMLPFVVPPATAAALRTLAKTEGATLHMTLLAAFKAFLHRHSGQDDFAVGSPVAGRERRETEPLLGFFVNTQVLRTDLSGEPTFRDLMARVKRTCLDAFDGAEVPFERLVEELQPDRDALRSPLFQAFFAFQNAVTERLEMPGLLGEPLWVESPTAKFDVSLFVLDEPPAFRCWLELSTDLFEPGTGERLVARFLKLLDSAATLPDARVGDLPILPEDERRLVLDAWNDTAAPFPSERRVHELVLERSRASPDRVAVLHEGERMTYAALDARSAEVARALRRAGVRRGDLVAVLLERCLDLPAALLGVLRCGAAYVPLDPSYPPERLAYMLEDSGASALLTHRGLERAFAATKLAAVDLDALDAPAEAGAPHADVPGDAHDLAYVIYTSGSTGKPKGTQIEHASLVNFLWSMRRRLDLREDARWLSVTTVSFDIAALELYLPLLSGAAVDVATRDATRDPALLAQRLASATHLQATPATWRMLLDAGWTPGGRAPTALCGGEAFPPELAARLLDRCPEVWNLYGPTETTVWSTAHRLARADARGPIPIGRPLDNTRVLVLDARLRPVPVGVPGELCIGGAGVARGYLGRPELTAERFVDDPFRPKGRVYRTGDLARWRPDGTLECLGRLDRQLKVRGHRIEPGEIEAALAEHPRVRHAVVDVRPGPAAEARLLAWFVAREAQAEPGDVARDRDGMAASHVERWRPVFDARAAATPADPTFDTSVWSSSLTGEPFPEADMSEWVETTVARLRALAPRRILEIGVGTGLLMWRLAPGCERYVGTDLSPATLDRLGAAVRERGLSNVELVHAEAADLSNVPDGPFDLVVLNSVAQYFPDFEHLARVAEGAAARLSERGALFLGDVRSLALLDGFHASVEIARGGSCAQDELARRVARRIADEAELVVHPAAAQELARRLGRVTDARVMPRDGRRRNEMSCHRYDIVLRVGAPPDAAPAARWIDWRSEGLTLDRLRADLQAAAPASLGLLDVPNDRVAADVAALRGAPAPVAALDPEDLRDLARDLGYSVETSWASARVDGAFDAALRRDGRLTSDFPAAEPRTIGALTNEPARERERRERAAALAADLREHLARLLPDAMVPTAFVAVDAMPLTPNGKVDRRALRAPEDERAAAGAAAYVPPGTPTERALAGIWSALLGGARVGRRDGFFALGGHSLLAAQMVARVRAELGADVPLRAVFAAPTLEALALVVEDTRVADRSVAPLEPSPDGRDGAPLSPGQERLWYFHQLDPSNPAYNVAFARRLRGPLRPDALERALAEAARRHEALRTTVALVDGAPVQRVHAELRPSFDVEDLSALPSDALEAEARRRVEAAAHAPFDLVRGPILRARLLRLGPEEHVLLVGVHHIAFDEWSERILLREVAMLYDADVRGAAATLPPVQLHAGDVARAQHAFAATAEGRALVDGCAQRLHGMPALELPLDRARPPTPSFRGRTVPVRLPVDAARALRDLAREQGATPFMAFLALFEAFLQKHSGQDTFGVAAPAADRDRPGAEGVVGFLVNTLVVRADLAGDPTFRELLRRAKAACLDAYAQQEAPFEQVVDALGTPRDLARPPLAQAALVMMGHPDPIVLAGIDSSPFPVESRVAKFDLTLWASETDPAEVSLEYDEALFDAATVRRFGERLGALLDAAAREPDRALSQLDAMRDDERRLVLDAWTGEATSYPRERLVHELFEEQARRVPGKLALVGDGSRLTYAELDARADALAARLRTLPVAADTLVGVCIERSPEAVVAFLAALKAGGAYLPLDPAHPADRLAFQLRDAGAVAVVTTRALAPRLASTGATLVLLDDADDAPATQRRARAPPQRPESLAYVMHTSGSTGRPKGVMVPHRAIVRLVTGQDYVRFSEAETFLHYAPAAFDASTFEIWGALLHGATVAIAPARRLSAHELGDVLRAHGVTTLWLTAPLFHLMVDENLDGLAGVRQLIAGGDALSVPHVRRARERLPAMRLVNGYGPTECTTFACCHAIGEVPPGARSIPIGRPIANTRALVLDERRRPVPPGVAGELYLGGDGLARGYLGEDALTAERFVADPLSPGERLYRTGDRVRWLPDGILEFLGRLDAQVKVRGFRVEPGEVESVLAQHEGVALCAVVARDDSLGGKKLVAYAAPAHALASDSLRSRLRERLPEHMVPSTFVLLDRLPLNANGKVDRRALPDPAAAPSDETAKHVAPHGPTEETLALLWAAVLGRPRVGARDDFFALGGNSLLATRLVSRIRQALSVDLPLPAIFRAPTVEALAREVDALRASGAPVAPPVVPRALGAPTPLSSGQQRLWFLHRWRPESPVYNNAGALRIRGPLDTRALESALDGVVRRHEALRTVFPAPDGEPRAVVLPHAPLRLLVEEVAGEDAGAREEAARRLAEEHATGPFDLERGPVFRFRLLRLAPHDHVLLVAFHHVAFDGWSLGVLLRELREGYAAGVEGREPRLAPPAIQYGDYAVWQQAQLAPGGALASQVEAWRDRLAGLRPLDLPSDRARPTQPTLRGRTRRVRLPRALVDEANRLAAAEGATLYVVLLAAFHSLVHRATGRYDFAVGSPVAGRRGAEVEPLIGFFVNTLPMRADFSGDPTFREALRRARATALEAFANADAPFERLVEAMQVERDPSRPPLVQALFALQERHTLDLGEGLHVEELPCDTGTSRVDLTLSLEETPDGLEGYLECNADLFDDATVARFERHYARLLASALASPDSPVSTLALASADERNEVETWQRRAHEGIGRCRVLDAAGHAVPIGIVGDLWAGDAEPFARTGERARWRPDGTLERLGRAAAPGPRARTPAARPEAVAYLAPREGTEARLAAIWVAALGVPRVGARDGFFDLGGHSLLVAKVVARVRDELGVEIPLSAVFESPTVETLARVVDERLASGAPRASGIKRAARERFRVTGKEGAR